MQPSEDQGKQPEEEVKVDFNSVFNRPKNQNQLNFLSGTNLVQTADNQVINLSDKNPVGRPPGSTKQHIHYLVNKAISYLNKQKTGRQLDFKQL